MCGICGFYTTFKTNDEDIHLVEAMNHRQRHRGPDDEGLFVDEQCVLGHRRLAVIDLSKDGHQPFFSEDKRYVLIYNGEIYNYIELRRELESLNCVFHTKTDTEVLLKSYQQWGISCLHRFNGMFAFAIYDTQKRTLLLARDRFGVKPLYYIHLGSHFYFASEIKSLRLVPCLKPSVRYQSLFDYLVFNRTDIYDETFLEGIKRIPKGHYGFLNKDLFQLTQWWDADHYLNKQGSVDFKEAIQKLEELLISATHLRMRSDVTVGSCLSGGLDSSILTGILFTHCKARDDYPAFTSSLPGHQLDETKYIDFLNHRYPFKNYRTYPTAQSAYQNFNDFIFAVEEPVGDATFYAQYEVMRLAKENGVTVLLDGQGADESFAGYQYFHGFYLNGLLRKRRYGPFLKELTNSLLRSQKEFYLETLAFRVLPDDFRKKMLLKTLPFLDRDFFYQYIDSSLIYKKFFEADDLNTSLVRHFQFKLEHLLRIEDRTSMAFSLEARLPYLDYRLVEYVLGLPEFYKIKNGQTKYLQKKSVGCYTVPEILNRRDKIGFGIPTSEWMNTPAWKELSQENYSELQTVFPKVFRKDRPLPEGGSHRWKMNQLAAWKQMILVS